MVGLNSLFNIVHPIYVQIENPEYHKQVQAISKAYTDYALEHKTSLIFCENDFSPNVYSNSTNVRMLLEKENGYIPFDSIKNTDRLLFSSTRKIKFVPKLLKREYTIDTLISPIKGKLSISSLYRTRTDSLGLYLVTLK
jgi:hypothetical protein